MLDLRPNERVLDVGCGIGEHSRCQGGDCHTLECAIAHTMACTPVTYLSCK